MRSRSRLLQILLGCAVVGGALIFSCTDVRHGLVGMFSPSYAPAAKPLPGEKMKPIFDGNDEARARIGVELNPIGTGFIQTTDILFAPGDPRLMIVLEKAGTAKWFDLARGEQGVLFRISVLDDSEQGLLGLAFHPQYSKNGKFYLNYTTSAGGKDIDRVAEWTVPPGSDLRRAKPKEARVILDVVDPYQNHNAGQLQFGPDGYLYVSFGDGGWANDPHNHGQNTETLLGDILRIDVDKTEGQKQYAVPADNPFVGRAGFLPEIWAYGLRNPWKYSFDPQGRLIVADVGQDEYEEIDIVEKGANLGWKIREAAHCFQKETCATQGLVDPIFEYGRADGGSVTGGFVALSDAVPEIKGKYVFGDFLSGRLWALELPAKAAMPGKVFALGRWPILPSTFGRDESGVLYVSDYSGKEIYRIDRAQPRGGAGGN